MPALAAGPPRAGHKVSVLLFNLRESRPAKLTTPLNKVKRLLPTYSFVSARLWCAGENIPPLTTPTLANSLPQATTIALNAFSIESTYLSPID